MRPRPARQHPCRSGHDGRPSSVGPDAPRHRPRAEPELPSRGPGNQEIKPPPKEGASALLSRRETAHSATFQPERGAPADTASWSPSPASHGRAASHPHSLGVQPQRPPRISSLSLQTRGTSTHTPASRWHDSARPTHRCICSHKAGGDKPSCSTGQGRPSGSADTDRPEHHPLRPPKAPSSRARGGPASISPLWGRHRHCTSRTLKAVCFCPTAGLMQDCRPAHDLQHPALQVAGPPRPDGP